MPKRVFGEPGVGGRVGGGGGRQHQEPQALPVATPLNTSNAVLDVGEKSGARKTRHVYFSAGIASELDFFVITMLIL